ncbi:MAG: hypothetical protein ACYCOR_15510 [Acidobacteriaceae bacterium]
MQWFSGIVGGLAAVAAIATLCVIVWYSRGLEKLTTLTNAHLEKMADIAERQAAFATVQDGRANLSRLSALQSVLQEAEICYRMCVNSIPRSPQIQMLDHVAWVLTQVDLTLDADPGLRKDLVKVRRDCADLADIGKRKARGEQVINAEAGPWNDLGDVLPRLPTALEERIKAYGKLVSDGLERLSKPYPPVPTPDP